MWGNLELFVDNMKKNTKRLSLDKLTIRVLDSKTMTLVAGGAPKETGEEASCGSCSMTCTNGCNTTFQSYEC